MKVEISQLETQTQDYIRLGNVHSIITYWKSATSPFLYTQSIKFFFCDFIATSCQKKFHDSGGCCTAKENDCYVGIDIYNGNRCSCSANCYDNQNLKCCPDIGCPSKFSSLLIKNMCASITMDTSAAEVQILNMAQY